MVKKCDALKKSVKEEKKYVRELQLQKETLTEDIGSIQKVTKDYHEDILIKVGDCEKVKKEIQRAKDTSGELSKRIWSLEKEKEKFGKEASMANARYHQSLEEVKLKKNIIAELQKKKAEADAKLKYQQNLYEGVRSERNLFSKNLIEN